MIEEIPDSPPFSVSDLDGTSSSNLDASGGYWVDSSSNYNINSVEESTYHNTTDTTNHGKTFAEIYPDAKLKFYKRLHLVPVETFSNGRVWGSFTDYSGSSVKNKNSVLEHAVPFKYDDVNSGYLPIVYRNFLTPPSELWSTVDMDTNPEYWLMDAGSGYLLFYQTTANLESYNIKSSISNGIQDPKWAPRISCFVYNGKTGITNLDVSGQVQVGDLSGALGSIGHIDRMILPDGSANVLDLCGNDAIRSQYNYVRKNMFVGYPTQPVINNSNVDHTQDPSLNNVFYELDVSGSSLFNGTLNVIGKTTLTDVSTNFVTINDNLDVSGNVDISRNVDISGTLDVIGKTTLVDVSAAAITITGNNWVGGDLDVDGNVNVDGNLKVEGVIDSIGDTRFVDNKYLDNNDISG